MNSTHPRYIGIDPFAREGSFTFSILDENCHLIDMGDGFITDINVIIQSIEQVCVAVNGPRRTNIGLVKKELSTQNLLPGQKRGGDIRMAEKLIRDKGINISATPSREELCPEWMQLSFLIFNELDNLAFFPFPTEGKGRLWIETHAQTFFYFILGQKPFAKSSLEGRLQRQLSLFDSGVGIHNPMKFFEEITRHKLLKGLLPLDLIYSPEKLDSLSAAYMAYLTVNQPYSIELVGSEEEGKIVIPIQS
jgi:hypothetical protein